MPPGALEIFGVEILPNGNQTLGNTMINNCAFFGGNPTLKHNTLPRVDFHWSGYFLPKLQGLYPSWHQRSNSHWSPFQACTKPFSLAMDQILDWLVVWTPLKNMSSSGIIPNTWKNNTCSKPPNKWRILSHMSRSEPRDGPFDILNVNGFEPVQYAKKRRLSDFLQYPHCPIHGFTRK